MDPQDLVCASSFQGFTYCFDLSARRETINVTPLFSSLSIAVFKIGLEVFESQRELLYLFIEPLLLPGQRCFLLS